ncbi:MAG: hypothetical protein ACRENE_29360 [Polyangiaceae bacterium]
MTKSILFISSLLGVALAAGAGCSSSSSGSPAMSDDASATDDSSTSSSSGGGDAAMAPACTNSTMCTAPQVCCVALNGASPMIGCAAAPCAPIALLGNVSVQLCATDAECNGGVCGKTGNTTVDGVLATMGGKACGPAAEGGMSEGGSSGGSSGGGDAAPSEGGSSGGGDAASEGGSSSGGSSSGGDAGDQ